MATAEENKAIIRRGFEEAMNQRKLDLFEGYIAPNYVNHDMPAPGPGPEGLKAVLHAFFAGFPDMNITIEDMIGEGNTVATRGYFTGTHQGEFNGIDRKSTRLN